MPEARRLLDWVREEVKPAGGDDPLAGPVFPRFWTKGQEGSAVELRQAAAALLAGDKDTAADAIPLLTAELEKAADAASRHRLQLALAVAYELAKRPKELIESATALAATHPNSIRVFSMIISALKALGRWDDLEGVRDMKVACLPLSFCVAIILAYLVR